MPAKAMVACESSLSRKCIGSCPMGRCIPGSGWEAAIDDSMVLSPLALANRGQFELVFVHTFIVCRYTERIIYTPQSQLISGEKNLPVI